MSMDDTENPTDAKPKKGKSLLLKLSIALTLLGAGGGGAFALIRTGVIGEAGAHKKVDNHPRLIRKGEEDPYAPKSAEGGKEGEVALDVAGDGGSVYRTVYYSFSDDFTSNLRNSDALIQASIAASTRRDGRVLMWMKQHELAIRSGMLEVLADTPEEDAYTLAGKERLQKRLTAAINKVLTDSEGFGGVDAVYFKSFLVH